MLLKRASLAAAAVAVLGAASPGAAVAAEPIPPGTPSDIFATGGGESLASFVGFNAILNSELWFFGSMYPTAGGEETAGAFLFDNGATGSASGDRAAFDGGSSASIGSWTAGTKLIFGLYVPRDDFWFFTGPAGENMDTNIHAKLTNMGGGVLEVGFEDLCRGAFDMEECEASTSTYISDWDYDDHVFQLTNATSAPEPVSMALLGTGLFGVAAARRRRKQQQKDEEV